MEDCCKNCLHYENYSHCSRCIHGVIQDYYTPNTRTCKYGKRDCIFDPDFMYNYNKHNYFLTFGNHTPEEVAEKYCKNCIAAEYPIDYDSEIK